jgi:hypothetical protein
MSRDFNVIRRRTGIVDMLTPKRANVGGYRIQAAPNFDGSFVTLFTAPISSGYLDPAINREVLHSVNNRDHIRMVFNPNTFTGAAGITDAKNFWIRFVPVDLAGSAGTPGNPSLVLTDTDHTGNSRILIAGTAPNGASIANSLQLDLPFTSQDLYIKNEQAAAGTALFVADFAGGSEQQISAQETLSIFHGPVDTLVVRGAGGTVAFSASFTNYLPI